ncbi:MAG TPA: universal stress protein [Vicinamibacterales bacterium]|jgi:nucleotide-binding universal stress UspA family protein
MVTLKNILVATDFSEPSGVALNYGRDLARSYNARLHVIHVVEDILMRYSPEIAYAVPQMQKDLEETASRDLKALITDDDRNTLMVEPVILTGLNMAESIVSYAKDHAIDLIIAGTHGRGAVKHFLMGSVAERVVRFAPCPVLTVREHERDFIGPDAIVATATA